MKRSTLILLVLLSFAFNSYSQSWQQMGPKEDWASLYAGNFPKIATHNGNQFMAFEDSRNGGKATVRKFSNNSWSYLGTPGFSAGQAVEIDIDIASNGIPYVAYIESGFVYVKQFDGTSWISVGPARLSNADARSLFFAVGNDVPYVCYRDQSASHVLVKKYDGTAWQDVSSADLNLEYIKDFSVSDNNIPYLCYASGFDQQLSVKKYDGTSWLQVGTPDFTSKTDYVQMHIDHNDTPYVFYKDVYFSGYITAQKFDGSSWNYVGGRGFSQLAINTYATAMGTDNIPYITYSDPNSSTGMIVRKFDGITWPEIPGRAFKMLQPAYFTMATAGSNEVYLSCIITAGGAPAAETYKNNKWMPLSSGGITECNGCWFLQLMQAKDGTSYIGYLNEESRVVVKRFSGTTWDLLPGGMVGDTALISVSLDMSHSDTMYAAYIDQSDPGKIVIKKFDGSQWIPALSPYESVGGIWNVTLRISRNGTPFISFTDRFDNRLSVAKWDGQKWNYVGPQYISNDYANLYSFTVDHQDVPYVANDQYYSGDIRVQKYDGSAWVAAGDRAVFTGIRQPTLMVTDSNEVLFYFYTYNNSLTTINKLKPGAPKWEILKSLYPAINPSVALDKHNRPFVSYFDPKDFNKLKIKKYIDAQWVDESTIADNTLLAAQLSIRNENAVVVYSNYETFAKGGILKPSYIEEVSAPTLTASVYPNPANSEFRVAIENGNSGNTEISLSDMLGRQVHSKMYKETGEMKVNTDNIQAGVYILSIMHNGLKTSQRISIMH